jgi:hypothetical protein
MMIAKGVPGLFQGVSGLTRRDANHTP